MSLAQIFETSSLLFGGIGMFLLAVKMITDGLKIAAGRALRDILGRWTSTPARGIRAGIAITAVVQSSSAVTVATIGFVNAGLLTLYQAIGIIYGTNIGTTMTGWLVAAMGFKINVETFALPLIGAGMLLRLTGSGTRRGALGEALAGFGLFFIGIDILKTAFEGMAAAIDISRFMVPGFRGVALFVAVGFLMSLLTQSSSAAIAITLTAATGGLVTLAPAAAMVIGANLGTTSTAALAVIGATPNAKRVAGAHVLFNGITGGIALIILPAMLWFTEAAGSVLGLEEAPAVSLALFHTTFNVLGVTLMWPFTARLSAFLQKRFRTADEERGRPRYLDRTVSVTPALALNALVLELTHLLEIVLAMGGRALAAGTHAAAAVERDREAAESLMGDVGEFVTRIHGAELPRDTVERLTHVIDAGRYFLTAATLAAAGAWSVFREAGPAGSPAARGLADFRRATAGLLEALDVDSADFSLDRCESLALENKARYEDLKSNLLASGARGDIKVVEVAELLEQISRIRRFGERVLKGVRLLKPLRDATLTPYEKAANAAGDELPTGGEDAPVLSSSEEH